MSTATAPKFVVGDLVWAKMKGFSPWPGKIVEPTSANLKRPAGQYKNKSIQCVYFFGSNNYAWIPEDAIKPYTEHKEQNVKLNKSHTFKEAIEKIEEYIATGGKSLNLDGNTGIAADGNNTDADGKGEFLFLLVFPSKCSLH